MCAISGLDVLQIIAYIREEIKKNNISEQTMIGLIWFSVMSSVEWNKKEELVTEQAIKLLKVTPLLLWPACALALLKWEMRDLEKRTDITVKLDLFKCYKIPAAVSFEEDNNNPKTFKMEVNVRNQKIPWMFYCPL